MIGSYVTAFPRKFVLQSGRVVTLTASAVEEKLVRETWFRPWIPDVEAVHRYLSEEQGFEVTIAGDSGITLNTTNIGFH